VPIDQWWEQRDLDINDRLGLLAKVCEAVHHAHRNLVVHRDIKPKNILVTPEGEPKLLDFGIATLEEDAAGERTHTLAGNRFATPDFASPEQIRGEPVTTAGDIYSLGVLAYLLITGRYPIWRGGKTGQQTTKTAPIEPSKAVKISGELETTPPPGLITRDIDTIIRMAMRPEPERRYSSAQQMAQDIRRCLEGYPIAAVGDSFGYVTGKFLRRHRLAVSGVSAFLMVAVALVVMLVINHQRRMQAQAWADRMSAITLEIFQISDPYRDTGLVQPNISAHQLLDRARDQIAGTLDDESADKADFLAVMGRAYKGLGHYEKARLCLEESLHIQETIRGEDDPRNATVLLELSDLALIDRDLGTAKGYLERTRRLLLPGASPQTEALMLRGFGRLDHYRHQYDDADNYFKTALETVAGLGSEALLQKALLEDDLALNYYKQEKYEEALEAHRRALDLVTAGAGENHFLTARVLDNYGTTLRQTGCFTKAIEHYSRAMDIRRGLLGDEHLEVADSLNNIGIAHLRTSGRHKAEPLLRRALAIRQKYLGDHPLVAKDHNGLAMLYRQADEFEKAIAHHHKAIRIRKKLGPFNEVVAQSYNNIANVYWELGAYDLSAEYSACALMVFREKLGDHHTHVAHPLNNLSRIAHEAGEWEEAERLYQRTLAIRENTFGRHLAVADSLVNYGRFLGERIKNFPDDDRVPFWTSVGEEALNEALSIREMFYGEDHRVTLKVYEYLVQFLETTGRGQAAEQVQENHENMLALKETVTTGRD
jgi:serine/threonine-protein kinase